MLIILIIKFGLTEPVGKETGYGIKVAIGK